MHKPKILVVDDTAEHRQLTCTALSAWPVEVVEAASGREALAAARAHDFAVALIDIRMEGMDGYEVAAMLRQEPRTAVLPLVFTTGTPEDPQVRRMAYRMGAAGVLLNAPSDPELIRLKIRAFLDLDRVRHERLEQIANLEKNLQQAHEELTRQKRETESVRRQSTNDLLTGLPNRQLFEDRINGALIRARRNQQRLGLAYLDLDGFKPVNEKYGRAAGDEVLAAVARRLVTAVRASDTVARLGSDEFAIVLEALDSAASADFVGQKILKAFADPIPVKLPEGITVEVKVSVSVGLALCPEHADNRNDLLMLADMAMYAVKRDGGGLRVAVAPSKDNVVSAEEYRRRQTPER